MSARAREELPGTLAELFASREPLLVGVRHHSPACAATLPALLDDFAPERVLVELPADLADWLPWLGHAELEAPVALAATRSDQGASLFFYPFADFSPELAAVRWAVRNGVTIEAIDRPYLLSTRRESEPEEASRAKDDVPHDEEGSLLPHMLRATGADSTEELWDRLVEAHAPAASAEEVRRAALSFGWALRSDAERRGVPARDRARERYMRQRLLQAIGPREAPRRVAAVVGSFHAAALLSVREAEDARAPLPEVPAAPWASSLVPYAFELLDSRSGYPAGIRDPMWQELVWRALAEGGALEDVLRAQVVAVARAVRSRGHVAGVPDASEAVRMALDLARLRRLPSPGRREVLEAIESALGRGEPLGRGRVLARALQEVMVGGRRGKLPPGTPRSGLAPHVQELLRALRLPGSGDPAETLRLDPLRAKIDRERLVTLERLAAANVIYAARQVAYAGAAPGGPRRPLADDETLGSVWRIEHQPATEASLELAGLRGVTLAQAAEGSLRAKGARLAAEDQLDAGARLDLLEAAAACGLAELTREGLVALMGPFVAEAGLAELVRGHALLQRIARGHVPGLPTEPVAGFPVFVLPLEARAAELVTAAIRAVEGLAGSTRAEDAHALVEIARLREDSDDAGGGVGAGRLFWTMEQLARDAGPFMQGAASAALALFAQRSPAALGTAFGSWIDGSAPPLLTPRVAGAMTLAGPLLEADPTALDPVMGRVEALTDEAFLHRVAALRGGFDVLSTSARDRLLAVLSQRLPDADNPRAGRLDVDSEDPPALVALWAAADRTASAALAGSGLLPVDNNVMRAPAIVAAGSDLPSLDVATASGHTLSPRDRWRLLLGRESEKLSPGALRVNLALEELYGRGHGEGSRRDAGGGQGSTFPTVREWSTELEALFGPEVREEVLGRAAERGRAAAAMELDPDTVTPSIELLESVLALKGGLAEQHLARLRRLIDRIVAALVDALSTRVRPALTGLATPRVTHRATGPLDLRRTVAANLRRAGAVRRGEDGDVHLAPERFLFKTRARRSLDWHLVLVVDVSGSMEASVIHSALMAAILGALPALTVSFVAFNDRVIDLTSRVDDPLGLLLEISVGGGTDIGRALRYARGLLKVPARSLVVVVSDFEEGGSVGALLGEVRELVESGARPLGLAALDEKGVPTYQRAIAELVVGAGMPVAALTPLELARWVAEQIQ